MHAPQMRGVSFPAITQYALGVACYVSNGCRPSSPVSALSSIFPFDALIDAFELVENSGNLVEMRSHLPRLSRLLRASFMAVLLLGLIIQPVTAQLTNLHAVEHAAAALAEHGHDHGPGDVDLTDAGGEDGPGQDEHAAGAHGLMHQCGGSTTLTSLVPTLSVPIAFARMQDLPLPASARIPRQSLTTPFRPPIA
jgi:hypothetical protein